MEIITSIQIQASPEKVWSVLTDYNSYGEWNSFIKSIKGEVAVDQVIEAHVCPPESNEMTFKPVVLVFDENKELRWRGKLLFSGIFDGEHRFVLRANEDGSTEFIHAEKFSGILVPFMKKMLNGPTKNGFVQMNEALKKKVESLS
mgnify:FL=1|jgi:hypothetical protein